MNHWKSNLIFNDLHPLSRLKLENQLKVIVSSEDSAKHCFKYEWTLVDANFSAGPCLNDDLVADGFCDDDTNNLACNFDGGDCCGFEVLEDYCDDCDCLEDWVLPVEEEEEEENENGKKLIFSNFSCMFLNPNIFFQFEF